MAKQESAASFLKKLKKMLAWQKRHPKATMAEGLAYGAKLHKGSK